MTNYASILSRFAASILDGIIISLVDWLLSFIFSLAFFTISQELIVMFWLQTVGRILAIFIGFGYYVYFTGKTGQTPGKKYMNIKVVKLDGVTPPGFTSAFLREVVGKTLSAVIFLLGYLWAIWDPQKQAWHDKIAGTLVVKV